MKTLKFTPSRTKTKAVALNLSLLLLSLTSVQGLDTSQCTAPLGMESGEIDDASISSSTTYEHGNVGPQMGRVRVERQGGAWCPRNQVTSDAEEWLQIDLHKVHVISATETMGRFGNGQGAEFSEAYMLSYWRPELNRWVRYRDHTGNEILKGNINTYLAAKTELNPPIIASKIRILPYSYHRRTVCMRVEIYGCPFRGGLLSYSMKQGSKRSDNWNFYDNTYDGTWESNYLQNGLGQLTDGRNGPNNFKDDYYGHERGKGWVGWKRETKNNSSPVEIIFKFDSVREFSTLYLHTANQFSREVQVFSAAKVFFSVGGKIYSGEPITYDTKEDCIFEDPKNISIKLHHRIGQYVKIQLFFQLDWILVSEITFDTQPAMGNFTDEMLVVAKTTALPTQQEVGLMAQSDASESIAQGKRFHISKKNLISQPVSPVHVNSEEWTPATIILICAISSFVAIILVLLIILSTLVFRHKLISRGKIPPGSNTGTLSQHYENQHHLEFAGYVATEDVRKSKGSSAPGEYHEPFVDPQFSSFIVASNGIVGHSGSSGNSNNGSNGKMTEYYSCTLLSNPIRPGNSQHDSSNDYEYAVPMPNELRKLLPNQLNSPAAVNRVHGLNLQQKFLEMGVNEIQNIRMLRKDGCVFIGELENGSNGDSKLVAVKQLPRKATDKDKLDFLEEVRLLSSLHDPNVTQVLGVTFMSENIGVALEYLEYGDLCQFLKQNNKKLSINSLVHIASQVSSAMKYLSGRNIVHRDISCRNVVVGPGLLVKISHFATDTDQYSEDYCKLDGKMPIPIRWMPPESLFLGKYSVHSDVWSFGVVLWEILSFGKRPYTRLNDQEVIHNLRRLLIQDDSDPFEFLPRPHNCPLDLYKLMNNMWSRVEVDRPSFREIHDFLTRKNINFVPSQSSFNANATFGSATSSYAEHYIV